jgi:hypothetical protein
MSRLITRPGIEELRERIRRLEGAAGRRRLVLPFGLKAIDRHLPGCVLVLPDPAPAMTSSGVPGAASFSRTPCSTARRCSGLSFSR